MPRHPGSSPFLSFRLRVTRKCRHHREEALAKAFIQARSLIRVSLMRDRWRRFDCSYHGLFECCCHRVFEFGAGSHRSRHQLGSRSTAREVRAGAYPVKSYGLPRWKCRCCSTRWRNSGQFAQIEFQARRGRYRILKCLMGWAFPVSGDILLLMNDAECGENHVSIVQQARDRNAPADVRCPPAWEYASLGCRHNRSLRLA